jgi:hypothetical protein
VHQIVDDRVEAGQVVERRGLDPRSLGDVARHARTRIDGGAETLDGASARNMQGGDPQHASAHGVRASHGQSQRREVGPVDCFSVPGGGPGAVGAARQARILAQRRQQPRSERGGRNAAVDVRQ